MTINLEQSDNGESEFANRGDDVVRDICDALLKNNHDVLLHFLLSGKLRKNARFII